MLLGLQLGLAPDETPQRNFIRLGIAAILALGLVSLTFAKRRNAYAFMSPALVIALVDLAELLAQ
jgi:hypothetical protein